MKDRIFISYRKDDAKDMAGRIADRLKHHFSAQKVFFDASDIQTGRAWSPEIDVALAQSAIVIVVIGETWLSARTADGRRRLENPDDVVRREITTALAGDACVLPLAVNGARLPTSADLPPPLQGLAAIHGDRVRADVLAHATFDDDIDRLARTISRIISERRGPQHDAWRKLLPKRRYNRLIALARTILTSPTVPPTLTRRLMRDTFLRQDPIQDLREYASEKPLAPHLPYVEIKEWCREIVAGQPPDIAIKMLAGKFELGSWGAGDGDLIRDEALKAALHEKPKTFNGPAVRIDQAPATLAKLTLVAQEACYFDQRRSNLALDFQYRRDGGSIITLRDLLRQDYGTRLPPLDDPRLANTLGVAALIFLREDQDLTPYFVARSRDVAVFNYGGEWHCTASGVAEIVSRDRTEHFYLDSMYKELDEEVGILQHDLEFLAPIAFCREMSRGGKPQMFFIGITKLSRDAILAKLKAARKRAKSAGDVVENTAKPLLRRPSKLNEKEALKLYYDQGFTIEAAACLHYYLKCRDLG